MPHPPADVPASATPSQRRRTRPRLALAGLLLASLTLPVAPSVAQAASEGAAPAGGKAAKKAQPLDPIVFVHGSSGSALQFETQAMRFASNGYPQRLLSAYEYDTSVALEQNAQQVYAGLDAFLDRVRIETGAAEVDVLAHSRGTTVMHGYLTSSAARAAKVDSYVNYDGRTSATPPGGVRTLAVWGEGDQTRQIGGGASNVYFSQQGHTQAVTSPESFSAVYNFVAGRAPSTLEVVAEKPKQVTIAGRAAYQPENTGVAGATVQLWELDAETGHRIGRTPVRSFVIDERGDFGPVPVDGRTHYEFALLREGVYAHHFYYQPFRRDDHFVRLLTQAPGQGSFASVERNPQHVALAVSRNKEWWGDQSADNDSLLINGVNVTNAANTMRSRRVITQSLFDKGSDTVTDLTAPLQPFASSAFQTGIDVFAPADPEADGTTSVATVSRGTGGRTSVLNVANWPSDDHRITVQLRDYVPGGGHQR